MADSDGLRCLNVFKDYMNTIVLRNKICVYCGYYGVKFFLHGLFGLFI